MLLYYASILEQVVLVTHKMEEHTWQSVGRNDDDGNVEGWGWKSLYWRVTKREEGETQEADEWAETRHCYSTYRDCSGQVHQRVQEHKINTANMHRQWKLTVNSQNIVAMTQPRYRTQTSYILTVSLQTHCLPELNTSRLPQHTETRTVDSDVTAAVQTPMRTDRNKAYSTHSR